MWIAARDPRTPWHAKAFAGAVAGYPLSPIDLIPDVIPILGYLDDLLIVPAGIWLATGCIPPALIADYRAAALARDRPRSHVATVIVILAWLSSLALMLLLWRG